jgi:membrane-bound serine protease (ClpP class)
MIGRVITPLRPVGIAEFDGVRVDVVTDGEFIDKDSAVEVRKVEGTRVIVRRVRQNS